MTRAIVLRRPGGPEALTLEDHDPGRPGPGQVRARITAAGVNFHDVYVRSGLYQTLPLPGVPGIEAAGVVEAVGEGVEGWAPGDRASYASVSGAYVEARLIEARRLIRLPEVIDDRTAAAATLRGLTAHMLLHAVHTVRSGETILVHAAAGGVGAILTQWAASLGAVVIGVVSSPEKAALARAGGCAHVIVGRPTSRARWRRSPAGRWSRSSTTPWAGRALPDRSTPLRGGDTSSATVRRPDRSPRSRSRTWAREAP